MLLFSCVVPVRVNFFIWNPFKVSWRPSRSRRARTRKMAADFGKKFPRRWYESEGRATRAFHRHVLLETVKFARLNSSSRAKKLSVRNLNPWKISFHHIKSCADRVLYKYRVYHGPRARTGASEQGRGRMERDANSWSTANTAFVWVWIDSVLEIDILLK